MRKKTHAANGSQLLHVIMNFLMSLVVIKLMKNLCFERLAGVKASTKQFVAEIFSLSLNLFLKIKFVIHLDTKFLWNSPQRVAPAYEKFSHENGFSMMEINNSLHFRWNNFEVFSIEKIFYIKLLKRLQVKMKLLTSSLKFTIHRANQNRFQTTAIKTWNDFETTMRFFNKSF